MVDVSHLDIIASDLNDLVDDVFAAPNESGAQDCEKKLDSPSPSPPSISTHPLFSSANFNNDRQSLPTSIPLSDNLKKLILLSSPITEDHIIHPSFTSNLHLTRTIEERFFLDLNPISHNPVITVPDNSKSSEDFPVSVQKLNTADKAQISEQAKQLLPHEMEYICKVAPTELDLSLDSAVASSFDSTTPDEIIEDISVPKAIYICSKPAMIAVEKAIQHTVLINDISNESEVLSLIIASSEPTERDSKSPIPTLIISEVQPLQTVIAAGPTLQRGLKSQDSLEIPAQDDRNSFDYPIRLPNDSKPNALETKSSSTEDVNSLLEYGNEAVVEAMQSMDESIDFVFVTEEEVLELKQEQQDDEQQSEQIHIIDFPSETLIETRGNVRNRIEDVIIEEEDINIKDNEVQLDAPKLQTAFEAVETVLVFAAPIHTKSSVTTAVDIVHDSPANQTNIKQNDIEVEVIPSSDSSTVLPMLVQFKDDQATNTTNHIKPTKKPLIIEQMFKNSIVNAEEESPVEVRRHTNEDGDLPGITR